MIKPVEIADDVIAEFATKTDGRIPTQFDGCVVSGVSLEMWSVGAFRIFKFIEVECGGEIVTLTQKDFGKPVSVNIGGRWFGIANSPPSRRRSVLGSRRRRAMALAS